MLDPRSNPPPTHCDGGEKSDFPLPPSCGGGFIGPLRELDLSFGAKLLKVRDYPVERGGCLHSRGRCLKVRILSVEKGRGGGGQKGSTSTSGQFPQDLHFAESPPLKADPGEATLLSTRRVLRGGLVNWH